MQGRCSVRCPEQSLDGKYDHHEQHIGGAEPVVLAPEHEVSAKREDCRPQDSGERGLAVAREQTVEKQARDEDLERLDKDEQGGDCGIPQHHAEGNEHEVKGIEQPRLVVERTRSQAKLEVPEASLALTHVVDEVHIEGHVLLDGVRTRVPVGERGVAEVDATVYGEKSQYDYAGEQYVLEAPDLRFLRGESRRKSGKDECEHHGDWCCDEKVCVSGPVHVPSGEGKTTTVGYAQ